MPPSLQFIKDVYLAIYGLAVILIMVFMPEGLWAAAQRWMKLRSPIRWILQHSAARLDIAVTETTPLLKLEGLQKFFGGLRAVDRIDLEIGAEPCSTDRSDVFGRPPCSTWSTASTNRPGAGIIIDGQDVSQKTARRTGRTWPRPHLPEHPPVRSHVGTRERDRRRAAQEHPNRTGPCCAAEGPCRALQFVGLPIGERSSGAFLWAPAPVEIRGRSPGIRKLLLL